MARQVDDDDGLLVLLCPKHRVEMHNVLGIGPTTEADGTIWSVVHCGRRGCGAMVRIEYRQSGGRAAAIADGRARGD